MTVQSDRLSGTTAGDLVDRGLLGSTVAVASVRERLAVPGSGAPERTLMVRLMDGLEFEVLPSRGFDIGDTFRAGTPMSWFSPVQDARALPVPQGLDWLARFNGGLVTTCGLDNIGEPAHGAGQHGSYSHLAAHSIHTRTGINDAGPFARLSATIDSVSLFGPSFRVERTIDAQEHAEGSVLTLTDAVTNVGPEPAPLSLMYHVNLGPPLVVPQSEVRVDADAVLDSLPSAAVTDWRRMPEPASFVTQAVFEHVGPNVDAEGYARAVVTSPDARRSVELSWTAATLPRLYQWVFPTRGRWALALEPAGAPLFGDERQAPHAGAPMLDPGETRHHALRIAFGGEGARTARREQEI
ncbi:DUF4432 family protein [uncultured Microbacterium sp.]|uniref:DUF4432 family protein n=1 Tax=uncultured Microbacterium sp. TaxID=191216 RepID=UPI0035C9495C